MFNIIYCLIVAAGLTFAATTTAQADPVSILILGAIGIEATATAIAVTTFTLGVVASIGLSYLAKALAPKPTTPDISSLPGGTTGKLQASGAVPRSFVVGRAMTAGSLAYGNTYSPGAAKIAATALSKTTAAAGNTPNAYLVQIIALSDIPVTGLAGLLVGGVPVTWSSGATPSFEGIAIPEYTVSGTENLWVTFYDGTQVAADPRLTSLFGSDPDRPYTSARVGTGIAYAVVTALTNQNLFSGFPQVKFILDGVKLYDRRSDTSVGGSGTQRWSTPSTWALTGNPVVIAENILRGISYGGKWVYGAQTVTATQLPSASWTAAASECDSTTALAGGGTELQFYASGEITFATEPASTLEELLKACNGRLAEIGGAYKIRAGAAGSAVFSFSDADILSTEQQTFDPFPSLGQIINAVTAKYVSPAEAWNPKDAAPLYDSGLEALDGGRRQPVDVNYSFVTSGTAVQRLMKSERDNQRAFRRHALPMPPDAFVLEPLDVISWTSTRNGYSSKLFEIITADDLPNLNMGLALKEIDPNAYDWTPATDEAPVVDGTIDILRPAGQPIVDWYAIPYTLTAGGVSRPAIELGWDPNTDDINGVQFEVRLAATTDVVLTGQTDGWANGSIIVSQNLIPNTAYGARGRYRAISARSTIWSDWLSVTTPNILIGSLDIASDAVKIAMFDAALKQAVTTAFTNALADNAKIIDLVASVAAEGDAAHWIDKINTKTILAQSVSDLGTAIVTATAVAEANAAYSLAAYEVTVTASFGDVNASVYSEFLARSSADTAIAGTVTAMAATINDGTTGLAATYNDTVTLQTLTADATHGNTALATRTTNLEATVNDGTTGLVATYNDKVTLQTLTSDATHGNTALAVRSTNLEATVNDGTSGVSATYSDVTGLQAIVGSGTIGNSVLAGHVTTLTGQVGSYSASVTIGAVVTNLYSTYSITLDTNGNLGGIVLNNSGAGTTLSIDAAVVVNGTIKAEKIGAGEITAVKMAASSVTAANGAIDNLAVNTLQVAGNAITVPLTASNVPSGGSTAGTSARITVFSTNMTIVGVSGQSYTIAVTGKTEQGMNGPAHCAAYLVVNGTDIDTGKVYLPSASGDFSCVAIGSYTFTSSGTDIFPIRIDWWGTSGGVTLLTYAAFVATAAKR